MPLLSVLSVPSVVKPFGCGFPALCILAAILFGCRYAWAERAKTVGYPERFAQEALGHNSKAMHRAYAKRALMKIPSLEEYERKAAARAGGIVASPSTDSLFVRNVSEFAPLLRDDPIKAGGELAGVQVLKIIIASVPFLNWRPNRRPICQVR